MKFWVGEAESRMWNFEGSKSGWRWVAWTCCCCLLNCLCFIGACCVCYNWLNHNFQRWMSRLGQRWRAQRSVITFVNCRIPWINRALNVFCAFGIYLKACLLWCLLGLIPVAWTADGAYLLPVCMCAQWCASHHCCAECMQNFGGQQLAELCMGIGCVLALKASSASDYYYYFVRHEVRLANLLNLSI